MEVFPEAALAVTHQTHHPVSAGHGSRIVGWDAVIRICEVVTLGIGEGNRLKQSDRQGRALLLSHLKKRQDQ